MESNTEAKKQFPTVQGSSQNHHGPAQSIELT